MRRGRHHGTAWGSRSAPASAADLEVLDPVTGEALPDAAVVAEAGDPSRSGRGHRLRRLALGLAALSVLSGGAAAYFAFTIWSVRQVERSWAEAMALDAAREEADAAVRLALEAAGDPDDDRVGREARGRVGDEVAAGLLQIEDRLRGAWLPDDRTDHVRDLMVEALRFRRFQLAPDRNLLGDTPLRRVEVALDAQLDRYGLGRSEVAAPALRSLAPALADIRRFTDVETATVLVASTTDRRRLLTVDVDASRVSERRLPNGEQASAIFGAGDLTVVVDSSRTTLTAYPADSAAPARWRVPGTGGVPGRPGTGVAVWTIQDFVRIVPVSADGTVGAPVPIPLPDDGTLLADTEAGLLVSDGPALRLWDPATGALLRTVTETGRFAGTAGDLLAVQSPGRPALSFHRLDGTEVIEIALPRTDAGRILRAPDRDEFAFAAGPLAGNIASVLRLSLSGRSWNLVGVGGPRVTVRDGGLAWSPSGDHLFWVTPDGRLALATLRGEGVAERDPEAPGDNDPVRAAVLRAAIDDVLQIVTFPARR